ncbi:phosphomannomutase [Aurantimonas sp. DM33-3]|uniref:phosphomannomutase n=1 Tax=Aurantimonas sp. DM33-3 TaxID=2766955 RepID=UPI0016528F60|nr:phosphomannomutase [Aurantimonas sp. DM33-3]MBC6715697.1 phosphomannomutase [Aurantimonas sp. DM33-3]
MDSLKFGTSGLRGLVSDLTGWPSFGYTLAFLRHVRAGDPAGAEQMVFFGRDLRASSPEILEACIAAAHAAGFRAVDCGAVPTPALALAAMHQGCPAVMITGSHIPDDRNGLKFYGRGGEITKADETSIAAEFATIAGTDPRPGLEADGQAAERDALAVFARRYTDFFARDALVGLTIGVFQHSSVARDLLADLVAALGGTAVALGRSNAFVPVDTEAHRPEDVKQIRDWAAKGRFDAIVSTDGDGDRPLVADAEGTILRGDVLGLLTSRALGLTTIVTPVTSSSAVETSGIANKVVRTKVGSPFVIAGMAEAAQAGAEGIVGFEANGGLLLGSAVTRDGRSLPALPTRDSVLPILATLAMTRRRGMDLAALVAELDAGHAAAHRLQDVPQAASGAFLARLAEDAEFRAGFFAPAGTVASVDALDGVRVILDAGPVVHFRASGNAPELRCYVEAGSEAKAAELLAWGLAAAEAEVRG